MCFVRETFAVAGESENKTAKKIDVLFAVPSSVMRLFSFHVFLYTHFTVLLQGLCHKYNDFYVDHVLCICLFARACPAKAISMTNSLIAKFLDATT
jgi:hypothetical protein